MTYLMSYELQDSLEKRHESAFKFKRTICSIVVLDEMSLAIG